MRHPLALGVPILALAVVATGPAEEVRAAAGWPFTPAATYEVTQPTAIVADDFDRDGKVDLAVADGNAGSVAILRGTGDGTFTASPSAAGGGEISALWAGDATLDGKPDLLVVRRDEPGAAIHAGRGDLTFAPRSSFGTYNHSGATDVVAFNWTHDLPPHFAFAAGGQFIDRAVRQPDGTFAGGGLVSGDFHAPRCVASADMTGDGWNDLVIGMSDATMLMTYRGENGGYDTYVLASSSDTRAVAVADLDRDGRSDVVAVGPASPTVTVHRNAWPEPFPLTEQPVVGAEGRDVAAADFDGDGVPDLLVVHADGWALLRGNGDCTFGAAKATGSGTEATTAVVGDFDRDGRPDFAVARRGTNDVEVRLNRIPWAKGGNFENVAALDVGTMPFEPVVGDLNRDGRPDVVSLAYGGDTMPTFLGTESGFTAGPVYPTSSAPRALALADLDHDGDLDVVTGSSVGAGVEVRLQEGAGFGAAVSYATGPWPYDSKVADVNRDGHPDLVVSHSWYGGDGIIATLLGRGDGTFGDPIVAYAGLNPSDIELADLNRDGVLDVVAANTNLGHDSTVSVLLGLGDGSFGSKSDYGVGAAPQQAAAVDLDRDGVLDLVVPNSNSESLSILRGRGDGSFDPAVSVPAGELGARPVGVVAGDFDRDGKPDVAVADVYRFVFRTFRGLGDLTFAPPVVTDLGARSLYVVSADVLDRDGLPDLVVTTYSEGTVRILRNVSVPAPDIAADPKDFGTFVLGDAEQAVRDVEIRNAGDLPLHVSGASIVGGDPGAFAVTWPSGLVVEVEPGATMMISVTCSADDAAPCAGVLEVLSDDPDQPALQVALTANPVAYLVTPSTGSIGAFVVYRGPLGPKGKAAFLLGRKSIAARTLDWTEGSPGSATFLFEPKSMKPATLDLVIRPKKAPILTLPGAFTVAPPEVLTVAPASAAAGAEVTVTLRYPGTRGASVALVDPATGKQTKCKVAYWDASENGAAGTCRFVVPKKLVAGKAYDLRATNGVGTAELSSAFTAQ